jgi:nitrate reductase alpha subunit
MMRVRIYAGMPRGVIRTWFNMYAATPGTVQAQKDVEGGPARNPQTSYVSLFRHGSHQSGTRAYLRPTQMTDSLTRKGNFGHAIGKGFEFDVHSATGAPKEAFVRVEKAEDGDPDGGEWRPVRLGLRPESPSEAMRAYLAGRFVKRKAR